MIPKFCLDNIGFENCLHIKGDILVTFDNDSIYSDFNKHYHHGPGGKTVTFTMNAPIKLQELRHLQYKLQELKRIIY